MRLELGSCVVRPWRASDAEALARHADSRTVWRNLRDAFPHPYSPADAKLFLGVVRGLGEAHWGRGIATAAVRAVTAHAFREHGLRRLFAVPFAWNGASARVLEKAGYTLEGRMRQSAFKDGEVVDQLPVRRAPRRVAVFGSGSGVSGGSARKSASTLRLPRTGGSRGPGRHPAPEPPRPLSLTSRIRQREA